MAPNGVVVVFRRERGRNFEAEWAPLHVRFKPGHRRCISSGAKCRRMCGFGHGGAAARGRTDSARLGDEDKSVRGWRTT